MLRGAPCNPAHGPGSETEGPSPALRLASLTTAAGCRATSPRSRCGRCRTASSETAAASAARRRDRPPRSPADPPRPGGGTTCRTPAPERSRCGAWCALWAGRRHRCAGAPHHARSTILRTGRLLAPSMPVSSSALAASPPQPSWRMRPRRARQTTGRLLDCKPPETFIERHAGRTASRGRGRCSLRSGTPCCLDPCWRCR
jgi:hypothetical protein